MCKDSASCPDVLYSGRIGSDCSHGTDSFSGHIMCFLSSSHCPGSPLDKSFLARFSAVDDHVVMLTGASMGGTAMLIRRHVCWFNVKRCCFSHAWTSFDHVV
jgi:hypothetical protein